MKILFVWFKENWLSVIIALIIIVLCIIIIDLFHLYPNGAELDNVQTGSIHWKTIVFVTIIALALFIIAKVKKNKLYELLKRASIYVFITIVFLILSFFVFTTNRWSTFDTTLPIDTDKWGQFGDFVGGTLGIILSLISVVLIAWTFQTQSKTAETQKFNDLFFELLHLYQSEVKDLCGQSEKIVNVEEIPEKDSVKVTKEHISYDNKDFFDEEKWKVQKNYKNQKSFEKNRIRSVSYYMLFYIENRSKIAAYFRTLYRIFELIDKSDLITESQRKEYAKIMRAQLTESELFFLRYNSMTAYGEQFVEYINRYHILKHLPAFELLEFKDWWEDMNRLERESVNILYYFICDALKDVFNISDSNESYKVNILPQANTRYQMSISLINRSDFSINIEKNILIPNMANEYRGLDKLDDKRIQQLLDCFIKEIFLYSNYNQFNIAAEIETYSSPIITKGSIVEIHSGIKNIKGNPLKYLYE